MKIKSDFISQKNFLDEMFYNRETVLLWTFDQIKK